MADLVVPLVRSRLQAERSRPAFGLATNDEIPAGHLPPAPPAALN